jgi:hypothetical protein
MQFPNLIEYFSKENYSLFYSTTNSNLIQLSCHRLFIRNFKQTSCKKKIDNII